MSALTVEVQDRAGNFRLVDDTGLVYARGVARASATRPGFVTLTFTVLAKWTPGTPIRIPADWYEALGAYEE